jgi:predicted porin
MKKTLIALAAVAATSAFAQSSVTLYGRLDAGYANQVDSQTFAGVTHEGRKNGITSHNSVSSYWGIMGTEDLGGGLKAGFKLEQDLFVATGVTGNSGAASGINAFGATTNQTSNGAFNRTSLLSLSGSFGTIAVGRDYVPTFSLAAATDVFGQSYSTTVGLAATAGSTIDRQFVYTTPNLSGFTGKLSYGNTDASITGPAATAQDGVNRNVSVTGVYSNGPLYVGLGLGNTEAIAAARGAAGVNTKNEMQILGASYDFGSFKLVGNFISAKATVSNLAGETRQTETNLGVTVPFGKITAIAQIGRNTYTTDMAGNTAGDASGSDWVIGGDYALSKRTTAFLKTGVTNKLDGTLNVTAANSLSGAAFNGVGDVKRTATSIGIRHTF